MNNAEYQSIQAVSSHWLIDLLKSPAYCWRQHLDHQRLPGVTSDALRFGTLVHCLALTPGRFDQEIIVMDGERRSMAGRSRWNYALASGLTPVKPAELDKARALVAAIRERKEVNRLLTYGRKERTIIQPRASGLLPLKARLDIHHEAKRQIVELKTTRDIGVIRSSMERYRYPLSAAFYRDLVRGQSTVFVFVETREPFVTEVFEMSREQLEAGREQWRTALARFDQCWLADDWPEADPVADDPDDDPLMMTFMPANNRPRFDLPAGELAL
jgi:hypothetical protein